MISIEAAKGRRTNPEFPTTMSNGWIRKHSAAERFIRLTWLQSLRRPWNGFLAILQRYREVGHPFLCRGCPPNDCVPVTKYCPPHPPLPRADQGCQRCLRLLLPEEAAPGLTIQVTGRLRRTMDTRAKFETLPISVRLQSETTVCVSFDRPSYLPVLRHGHGSLIQVRPRIDFCPEACLVRMTRG